MTFVFVAPVLRARPRRALRRRSMPRVCARDQFSQYAARDVARLEQQRRLALAHHQQQHHHHVLLSRQAIAAFDRAAHRFLNSADTRAVQQPLWMLRAIADPTFGSLRGEPQPPRVMLVHRAGDDVIRDRDAQVVQRWLRALDRAQPALTKFCTHSVKYAQWRCFTRTDAQTRLVPEHHVVAVEIVNADWTNAESVSNLRHCLLRHGARSTQHGTALSFDVLQSVTEPTCFKTLEVYESVHDVQQQLDQLDQQFDHELKPCRAAVNRVRQLYSYIGAS